MKLEMTLPERPGFLHAIPLLNIFALVQLFFLLGPSLIWQSGVAVELPPSRFQMERYETPLVVTLGPGEPTPRIHFARDSVTLEELAARLEKLSQTGAQAKAIVLLQTDTGTPVGVEREVTEMVLAKGFRLALVGKNAPETQIPGTQPPTK
ncbi:MAG: biopolymer transporter ExbD [Luteolibacter sp.]